MDCSWRRRRRCRLFLIFIYFNIYIYIYTHTHTQVVFMEEKKQALPFSATINKLDVNKCPDVSISYCFICLLHLANEKNLAILGQGQTRDSDGGSLCSGTYVRVCVCVCVCIYVYVCIYTHKYVYTHILSYILVLRRPVGSPRAPRPVNTRRRGECRLATWAVIHRMCSLWI